MAHGFLSSDPNSHKIRAGILGNKDYRALAGKNSRLLVPPMIHFFTCLVAYIQATLSPPPAPHICTFTSNCAHFEKGILYVSLFASRQLAGLRGQELWVTR